jgi:excisionase family DNA binding protein
MLDQATEDLLTPTQAARLLGVSKTRVIQLGEAGRLRYIRSPLGRLFDAEVVRDLVLERARNSPQGDEAA